MSLHVNHFLSWVEVKTIHVNDSGTWRSVKVKYVNDSGTWRPVFARGLVATLVAGSSGSSTGYSASPAFGSMSTSALAFDGRTVSSLVYNSSNGRTELSINGFGADPGQGYISLLNISGLELTGAGASFYLYVGGGAFWAWSTAATFANGGSYAVIIVGGG